jgi:Mrp family chromosome partitioning ATPase
LTQLRQNADIVILDTPPVAAVVDASILALQADGVLLVISSGRTKRDMARRTVDLLQQIRAQMLGVVLFNSPMERTLYKYYQRGYGRRVNLPETLGLHREWNSSSLHGQDVVKSVTLEYTNGDGRASSTPHRNPYS